MKVTLGGIALCVLLAGCSATPPAAAPGPTTAVTTPMDADPAPAPTSGNTANAPDVARGTMAVFVNHALSPDEWIAALAPYLSTQAVADWTGTDPANVPAHQVGAVTVTAATTYLTTVTVDTDAGTYTLLLSYRPDGTQQVERITPPEHGPVTP